MVIGLPQEPLPVLIQQFCVSHLPDIPVHVGQSIETDRWITEKKTDLALISISEFSKNSKHYDLIPDFAFGYSIKAPFYQLFFNPNANRFDSIFLNPNLTNQFWLPATILREKFGIQDLQLSDKEASVTWMEDPVMAMATSQKNPAYLNLCEEWDDLTEFPLMTHVLACRKNIKGIKSQLNEFINLITSDGKWTDLFFQFVGEHGSFDETLDELAIPFINEELITVLENQLQFLFMSGFISEVPKLTWYQEDH